MFGSPDIIGTTWWKSDGTDHFTVRDMILDGSNIIITTNDGRQINEKQLSKYIQSETPIGKKPKRPNTPKINPVSLMQGISAEDLGDIMSHDEIPAEPLIKPKSTPPVYMPTITPSKSEDDIILDRMFKHMNIDDQYISIDVEISDEFKNKISSVSEGFGISMQSIVDYIIKNKVISLENILSEKLTQIVCPNNNL